MARPSYSTNADSSLNSQGEKLSGLREDSIALALHAGLKQHYVATKDQLYLT